MRPLTYDLREFSAQIVGEFPNTPSIVNQTLEGVFGDIPEDEVIDVIMSLSLEEYIKLASSVDVGRDIAYPDESVYIWWLWVRSIELLDFCSRMINCIENSTGVQNALLDYLASRGITATPDGLASNADSLLSAGCDEDVVFGQVRAVFARINQNNIDFFEQMELASTNAELLEKAISAIPVVGLLPIDEAIGFVDKLFEFWTLEFYNASITDELIDSITCDLFCNALEEPDCVMTTNQLLDYFASRISYTTDVKISNVVELVEFLIGLPSDIADIYVSAMCLLQLFVVSIAESFLGVKDTQYYSLFASLGDPSDDWMILCEECAPDSWEHTINFSASSCLTIGKGSQAASQVNATFGANPVGSGNDKSLYVLLDLPDNVDATKITLTFDQVPGSSPIGSAMIVRNQDASVTYYTTTTYQNGTDLTVEIDDVVVSNLRIFIRSSVTDSGSAAIKSAKFEGFGTNPFSGGDC